MLCCSDVAEENIELIDFQENLVQHFRDGTIRLGYFFDDVDIDTSGRGRFLPSFDLRSRYPEDEEVASLWVRTGELPDLVHFGS
jgi:hypothetical protein